MITVDKLTVGYQKSVVIDAMDWIVSEGCIHGLIGLNGSGKTTLLKCMGNLIQPFSGNVLLNGKPIKRSDITYLDTEPYFYYGITGREFLALFKYSGKEEFNIDLWAELLNVPVDSLIDGYSTGMKKKLSLMMVIKLNRKVIMLDEPFNGLDLESARVLISALKKLIAKDKIIIVSSHIMETLTDICTEIHYLRQGKIVKTFDRDNFSKINNDVFLDLDAKIDDQMKNLIDP